MVLLLLLLFVAVDVAVAVAGDGDGEAGLFGATEDDSPLTTWVTAIGGASDLPLFLLLEVWRRGKSLLQVRYIWDRSLTYEEVFIFAMDCMRHMLSWAY